MSQDNKGISNSSQKEDLIELPEFREMKMRAEAAEARLRRIYNTPFWRYSKIIRKIYARINQALLKKNESNFIFVPNKDEGLPVVELVRGKTLIEENSANISGSSIAVVAHFSTTIEVSKSLKTFIKELQANGFQVILVSACEAEGKLDFAPDLTDGLTIIRKPNLGYDFGSWAVAFDLFPEILNADEILLTNDSLLGPFDDINELVSKLRNSKFDVTGITDNSQLQYHIQSYIVHLKRAAVQNLNTINLLKSVVHLGLKNDVILKYELGLTRTAQLSGLFVGALFPWNLITTPEKNPSLAGWQRLIELGFPFLKREAVRLGSHSEVTQMKKFLKTNYGEFDFIIQEIDSIS